ncbi:isochorismatase family protein [Pseudoxanthomonas winnipegensis]|uniref:isochorismatase family protein n=1 Tax=Pseudoxanthomonas winnipegensis TaxID=2480810 RepID=UPI003F83A469
MPAPRRALLVIDVQNEYFTGQLRIAHPPVSASLPNIVRAIDVARAQGVPVVVFQHTMAADAPVFADGSDGWALHPEVAARQHDHHLLKAHPSVFTATDLAAWLAARDIDTVTVVGYMTHNCNASSVFEAFHRGLRVEVLGDASGALAYANAAGQASAEEIHRVFSVVFHSNFAAVVSTDAWIAALQAGEALQPDNVLSSHQRARAGATQPTPTVVRSRDFTGTRAWEALPIALIDGVGVRLHWTDQPYVWHVNDGQEVFAVLDGRVRMHWRQDGAEQTALLEAGDVFHAPEGTEHVAHPQGAARILVIEREGSV